MAKIFAVNARAVVARIFNAPAHALLRMGVSPNVVTVIGTLGVAAGAIVFAVTGNYLAGVIIITLSALTDLLDGAMARARGSSSKFGALLDSTCDRIADGLTFGAVSYWLAVHERKWGAVAALVCLVAGQVVSYVKARAEGLGFTANVGLVERAERLIMLGIGGLLSAFGVTYGLDWALGVLALGSIITVGQRMAAVATQDRAAVAARSAASRSDPAA
jgi:CDP-diacylglycerol---glycerol-3-phosphate 3-phosphatidyltransferase